jgi:hypothetical protein
VYIYDSHAALSGVRLYIGDGATVRTQLGWCQREGVLTALITHCGSEIVAGDAHAVNVMLRDLAEERGIDARLAFDGMEVVLP